MIFLSCFPSVFAAEERFISEKIAFLQSFAVSEIAVFVDPMSFLNIQENSNIFTEMVRMNVDELWRCGAPFDFFNLNDLPLLDKNKYKLYIFLNALNPKEEISEYIKRELKDKYKFFVGAPGYASKEQLDGDGIFELTGIKAKAFTTNELETARYNGKEFGYKNGNYIYTRKYVSKNEPISPLFEITDDTVEPLAYYDNGKLAYGYKDKTFYCTTGNIPYEIFRDAAEMAGVHLYTKDGHGLAVTSSFIAINTIGCEQCTVTMPEDCRLIDLYEEGKFYRTENRKFTYTAEENTSKLFLIRKGL